MPHLFKASRFFLLMISVLSSGFYLSTEGAYANGTIPGLSPCEELLRHVTDIRTHLLTPVRDSQFSVGGQAYFSRHLLGSSSARVYLAFDRDGNKVSLKDYSFVPGPLKNEKFFGDMYEQMLNYEVQITRFLREMGEDVPDIRAVAANQHIVVKDYVFGLTRPEIQTNQKLLGLSDDQLKELDADLSLEIARLSELVSQSFAPWLYSQHLKLGPMYDSPHGFIEARNMIYNFAKKKWILFDP